MTAKTKLRIYSDIHLDWYFADGAPFDSATGKMKCWFPDVLPDEKDQVLVLAGDLWVGTKWIEWAGYSWIAEVALRFKEVIVVLGNHDYWPQGKLSIQTGADKCNSLLQDMCVFNVTVLDSSTRQIGEHLFVGATLWTDMRKGDPLLMMQMSDYMRYDGKIAFSHGPDAQWERFTSDKWVQTHLRQVAYIKHVAAQNRDKKLIVVTHHQPLVQMGDPNHCMDPGNGYYNSDLSDLILDNDNIVAWIAGHSHIHYDKVFPDYAGEGGCRMLMNAVGYTCEHREQQEEVKHEVVEL